MSAVSQYLSSVSLKAIERAGPGSNGYWRREMWMKAGAFTFTASKTGKHKLYVMGAAGGGGYTYAGASAPLVCIEVSLVAGDTVSITPGAGGTGQNNVTNGGDGGTTTVTCTATGRAFSVTITGATGGRSGGAGMATGTVTLTGTYTLISNFAGVVPAAANTGGPSSGSPWRVGYANPSGGYAGAGWGGVAKSNGGASALRPANGYDGASSITKAGGRYYSSAANPSQGPISGDTGPWWDLKDADGSGGAASGVSNISGGDGGLGAGAGVGPSNGGTGGIGGGGACSTSQGGGDGGNGAAGAPSQSGSYTGGNGGDGAVIIYFDEVA